METPPLARGRSYRAIITATNTGNTPARAGTIGGRFLRRIELGKHPRSRGDDCFLCRHAASLKETPPLARGRCFRVRGLLCELGNTPARAGTIGGRSEGRKDRRKHPRSRGDDLLKINIKPWGPETPPLARGRSAPIAPWHTYQGNTPARAGTILTHRAAVLDHRKHPRSRGDDLRVVSWLRSIMETPPLARGRLAASHTLASESGNTPARAGTIGGRFLRRIELGKHPRSRGDDPPKVCMPSVFLETPPLARGR